MKQFTDSVRIALRNGDWYGALTTALILPDICGRMEDPDSYSRDRYAKWFSEWVEPAYTRELPNGKHVFLTGKDCYALRCSLLHEGGENVDHQKVVLDNFYFIAPPASGGGLHMNQINQSLQLQVDIFCTDMASAVDRWAASNNAKSPEVIERLKRLLTIRDISKGFSFLARST